MSYLTSKSSARYLSWHIQQLSPAEGDTCCFKHAPLYQSQLQLPQPVPHRHVTFELSKLNINNWHTPRCWAFHGGLWSSALSYLKTQLPWLIQRPVESELNWVCSFIIGSNSDNIILSLVTDWRYLWVITGARPWHSYDTYICE